MRFEKVTILLFLILLVCSAGSAQIEGPQVLPATVQCYEDPYSGTCYAFDSTKTGSVSVTILGFCDNSGSLSVTAWVQVYNCSTYMQIDAYGGYQTEYVFQLQSDGTWQAVDIGGLASSAAIYENTPPPFGPLEEVLVIYYEQYCNGDSDYYASPPVGC